MFKRLWSTMDQTFVTRNRVRVKTIFPLVCYPLCFQYCVWKYLWVWHVWVKIEQCLVLHPGPGPGMRTQSLWEVWGPSEARRATGQALDTIHRLSLARVSGKAVPNSPEFERKFEFGGQRTFIQRKFLEQQLYLSKCNLSAIGDRF